MRYVWDLYLFACVYLVAAGGSGAPLTGQGVIVTGGCSIACGGKVVVVVDEVVVVVAGGSGGPPKAVNWMVHLVDRSKPLEESPGHVHDQTALSPLPELQPLLVERGNS